MLKSFLEGATPTFVLRCILENGKKHDFPVHYALGKVSNRLAVALAQHETDWLLCVDTRCGIPDGDTRGGKRQKRAGGPTRILEFYQTDVPAYASMTPNDPDPIRQVLLHLYAHIDGVTWDSPAASCPADELLEGCDPEEEPICINVGDEPVSRTLVAMLRLLEFFEAPTPIRRHMIHGLLYSTRHSNLSVGVLEELVCMTRGSTVGDERYLAQALRNAGMTLLHSLEPVRDPAFLLYPPASNSRPCGLQTHGTLHKLPVYDKAANSDVAFFGREYICEHLMDGDPLLSVLQHRVAPVCEYCVGPPCLCTVLTESTLLPTSPGGFTNFRFTALRDEMYVHRVLYGHMHVEEFRLRSHTTAISVKWCVTRARRLHIRVSVHFSNRTVYKPLVRLRVGVLAVYDAAALYEFSELGGDGEIIPGHEHGSDLVHFTDAHSDDHPRARELALEYTQEHRQAHGFLQHSYAWSLDMARLQGQIGDEVPVLLPPRLVMVQGSVTFAPEKIYR